MFGLDEWLAQHGGGGAMALLVAVLLGLRHATDPDHLTAVSTLVLTDQREGTRRAGGLGLAWGLGHALTLFLCGLPVVLFRQALPAGVQRVAEAAIGAVIVLLAVRLLLRWRRGAFHDHAHAHGAAVHAHPHAHPVAHAVDPVAVRAHAHRGTHGGGPDAGGAGLPSHEHRHAEGLGRSPLAAFGIGTLHGAGGSAAVGVLLVSAVPGRTASVLALVLFAAATALSMALVSTAFGYALARGPLSRSLVRFVPVFGLSGVLFGAWYALDALGALG